MALPVTISGVTFPTQNRNGRMGPFKSSGGNFYMVFADSTSGDNLDIFKATDPTSSWSQQATLDVNPGTTDIIHVAVHQEGDNLHIITIVDNAGGLRYHVFSMSSDSFTISNEDPSATVDNDAEDMMGDISVRSDGDVIILYSGDEDNDMGAKNRIDYGRREGGSWGGNVDIAVDSGGEFHFHGPGMIRGENDLMHFTWEDLTDNDLEHRSLTASDNSLSTTELVNDVATWGLINQQVTLRPMYYDAAGVERITTGWKGSELGDPVSSAIIEDDGTPDTPEDAGDFDVDIHNTLQVILATYAVETGADTIHLVYVRDGEGDLYYSSNTNDGGWSTDVELLDAVTINAISANVYTRGPYTVLAVVYDNGGTITYNEFPLAFTPTKLSDTAFSDQNYYHGPFEI